MKKITNWRNASVLDIETDDLLDKLTLMHVLSIQMIGKRTTSIFGADSDRIKAALNYHIVKCVPIVAHNGISFDIPALEKLLDMDLSKLMVIDTLQLSWYLNPERNMHGLDSFFSDYKIKKPPITDWKGLTKEQYQYRCEQDVKINTALWNDLKTRLYDLCVQVKACVDAGLVGGLRKSEKEVMFIDSYKDCSTVDEYVDRLLTFLMFKMDCVRQQEKDRFKVDVEMLHQVNVKLADLIEIAKTELESAMPPKAEYKTVNAPKKIYLRNGELTAPAQRWNDYLDQLESFAKDEHKNMLVKETEDPNKIKVLDGYSPPNINSSDQIKRWLRINGWRPQTFKYTVNPEEHKAWVDSGFKKEFKPKQRAIPQINVDGKAGKELCPSVVMLAEKIPEIMAYQKYTVVKHRFDMTQGFIRGLSEDGYLKARVQGLTNTLRVKHRELVNLPGVDKPFGSDIRGILTCEDHEVLLGSDLTALEDRVKMSFAVVHDPAYVRKVSNVEYDPHIDMCATAGMLEAHIAQKFSWLKYYEDQLDSGLVTKDEYERLCAKHILDPKDEKLAKALRKKGKVVNYSCVYGAGPAKIALSADIPLEEAKALHTAYWETHWYVKAIAQEQCLIKDAKGGAWLINPFNGFPYSIRSEKDIFSTLIQGSGSFFFDMWVANIQEELFNRYGSRKLLACFHDEFILRFKDKGSMRDIFTEITKSAIEKVNSQFMLRVKLDCGVKFGKRYSDIH